MFDLPALTDVKLGVDGPEFVSALALTDGSVTGGGGDDGKINSSRVHVVWSASKLFGMSGFRVAASYPSTTQPHTPPSLSLP